MSDDVLVDLFAEDHAHEALLTPLVTRVAEELQLRARVVRRSARGGHARAIAEFKRYQRFAEAKPGSSGPVDLVVVGIDGNCSTPRKAIADIQRATTAAFVDRLVLACPDPHVERWYLADPQSFESVVGGRPSVGPRKCARDHYKRILADAIRKGSHPPTLGGNEFAPDLVARMDLYRAGSQVPSLNAFLDALRASLLRLGGVPRS